MKFKITLISLVIVSSILWIIHLPDSNQDYAQFDNPTRIITTDWTIAETLLALQAPLVGVGDTKEYATWVGEPVLNDNIVDLGLRSQPNLEVIANLKPTLLINSTWTQNLIPKNIIPIKLAAIDFYTNEGTSWSHIVQTTEKLAQLVNRTNQAQILISQTEKQFTDNIQRLKTIPKQSYAVVQFIDSHQLRIYGANSLYGVVLTKLNLDNAWQHSTNAWGFSQISLIDLMTLPKNTSLIIVKPYPANVNQQLEKNSLWQKLPFSQQGNYYILPSVWGFGALPSMQRFSYSLTNALTKQTVNTW